MSGTSGVPGWFAPSIIISLLGAVVNLIFSVSNYARTGRFRRQDLLVDEFDRHINNPIELAIQAFESLGQAIYALQLKYEQEIDSSELRRKRGEECQSLNKLTVLPTMSNLAEALGRAQRWSTTPEGKRFSIESGWSELVDASDPLAGEFNTMCRIDISLSEATRACEKARAAAADCAASIRTAVARSRRTAIS